MALQDLAGALSSWRALLGSDRVLCAIATARRYGTDTTGQGRAGLAALRVKDRAEVTAVLEIARRHRIPLYPISTGKNWGYGGASPMLDGCVILDLSGMNRIIEIDRELGLVTLEPGVTQGELREYLDDHAPGYMVPTSGAGPHCSLIGNALERGYGITPYADHFGAITSIEAVLPDGRVYRSALAELGAETVDRAFKYGIGPYLDGLFAQGNIGIVTRMTIALASRPERVEAFLFGIADDRKLGVAVEAVQRILRELGGAVGAINLMNARRVLSMTAPYPRDRVGNDGILPRDVVLELARRNQVGAWTGVGALYGNAKVVRAARRAVRELLGAAADRITFLAPRVRFLTPERGAFLGRLVHAVPGLSNSRFAARLRATNQLLGLMEGRPSEVALSLAYWRMGGVPSEGALNPARDGSGLIWYSPLVPMKTAVVREYVGMVHEVCLAHKIEPLITLTSQTDRCFDSTVPLLFDRSDPGIKQDGPEFERSIVEQAANAAACFDALFEAGLSRGIVPYRLGIQAMSRVTNMPSPFWDLVGKIKSAVDVDGIIAPGRYAPTSASTGPVPATEAAK